jgi:Matrixin/Carboxypeptidase regulatory-like domain
MRRPLTALILVAILLATPLSARSYTLQFTDASSGVQIKWPTSVVTVALSSSVSAPPSNIKAGSDVAGAIRRAMLQWAGASSIRFVEASSNAQSVSPSTSGDGISLITVANTPENAALFSSSDRPGRTRVFFDPATGQISEADIALNPSALFSTDGTFGTYDLESVLTHELGHLLGLEHSGMVGATMQPRLAVNGLYTLPAFSPRTLSEDDRAGVRSLYGPRTGRGAIAGLVTYANGAPAYGAHVWVEDVARGRSVAGQITSQSGAYHIDDLPPGQYRLIVEYLDGNVVASEIASSGGAYAGLVNQQAAFRATEVAGQVTVSAQAAPTTLNISLSNGQLFLNPRLLGINGQLSTIAVPIEPSRTYTLYVGGEGLDQVSGEGISVTSPYIKVEASSLKLQQQLEPAYPIISFNIRVAEDVPAGEYDLRFRAANGEVSYIAGGLTVDDEMGALVLGPETVEPVEGLELGVSDNEAQSADEISYLTTPVDLSARSLVSNGRRAEHLARAQRRNQAAAAFVKFKPAAPDMFKALLEPLFGGPGERSGFGPS